MPIPFKPSSTPTPSTEKKHLSKNLSSTQTKRLVFRRDDVIVRYTLRFFFGLLVFAMISSVPIILALLHFDIFAVPLLILGSIFELIALTCIIYCLFNTRKLPVFDTLNGRFYPQGRRHAESAVSTKDIDYLQILEIEMSPGFCYELNAVMKDGNRLHITAHGGRQNFMKDAKQLAQNLALSIKDEQGEPYVDIPGKHEGPLVPGGVSFQSMRLVFRQDSITVKATWRLHLGYILFMAIGTGIFCMGLFSSDGLFWPALIMGALFAGIALLGSLAMILKKTFPLFDMVDGMFYPKGFTRDGSGIPLKQLDHLEIVKERVYNKNSSYDSYELNVVLKDSSRYNILARHGAARRETQNSFCINTYRTRDHWRLYLPHHFWPDILRRRKHCRMDALHQTAFRRDRQRRLDAYAHTNRLKPSRPQPWLQRQFELSNQHPISIRCQRIALHEQPLRLLPFGHEQQRRRRRHAENRQRTATRR